MSSEESGVAPDHALNSRALGSSYLIDTVIGRGSTGEVWRGRVRDTGAPIAAKVLDAALTREPEVVARFIRERALLTKVSHPNVVTVRDLVVEGDTLAIITDLVDGPSLRAVLNERGTLRASHAVELAEQMLLGLEAVHAQGLVHRDLKPENVLVARAPDGEAQARIVDFGIAQLAHGDSANARGEIVGSAEYIAPELLEGGAATPAADLYAVGIIVYELVCGRTPFAAENVVTVIRRQLREPAGRPAGMPMELWAVLQRLVAKNPERRPASAAEARELLTGVAASVRSVPPLPVAEEDDPVVIEGDETIITPRRRAEPATEREADVAPRRPRRRWWLVAVAALVVAAVVTSIAVVTGGDSAAAATIESAPEYWSPSAGGHPVVHRTLTLDDDAIRVDLRVTNLPARRYDVPEFIPVSYRNAVRAEGARARIDVQSGLLSISIPQQDAETATSTYRVALGTHSATASTLESYEQARVALLQRALDDGRDGEAVVALETAPTIHIHPFERAWLPVAGFWAGAPDTASVADSLGAPWKWNSSDPWVARVRPKKVGKAGPGRSAGSRYFYVDSRGRVGTATVSTSVGGQKRSVTVVVSGRRKRDEICEPGVVADGGIDLVRSGATARPVVGTLVSVDSKTVSKALGPAGGLAPLTGSTRCESAEVQKISGAEALRYVSP